MGYFRPPEGPFVSHIRVTSPAQEPAAWTQGPNTAPSPRGGRREAGGGRRVLGAGSRGRSCRRGCGFLPPDRRPAQGQPADEADRERDDHAEVGELPRTRLPAPAE